MAVFLLWLHITYQLSVISAMFPYVYEFKGPRILSRSGSAVAITTPYMPPTDHSTWPDAVPQDLRHTFQ